MKKINIIGFCIFVFSFLHSYAQEPVHINNLNINTKNSDFGATIYKDKKIIFSSTQKESRLIKRKWKPNMQPYLNLYQAEFNDSTSTFIKTMSLSKEINTKYHESSVTFSSDYSTVYFTRNNYKEGKLGKKSSIDNKVVLQIFKAININGIWSNIESLPFNSFEYSHGHPALSPDEKKLYFTSDRPGSVGKTDIFVVDILPNNKYSEPKNLGTKINTESKEMFPFVDENNVLYFSSNRGKEGFGRLDIYSSIINDNSFSSAFNLGEPINSVSDDFAFSKIKNLNKGYFSSNRSGGKGDDDIYSYQGVLKLKIDCIIQLNALVVNEDSGSTLSNVYLKLYGSNNVLLDSLLTNSNGRVTKKFECEDKESIRIVALKNGFNSVIKTVKIGDVDIDTKISLKEISNNTILNEQDVVRTEDGLNKIDIGNIYFDFNKSIIKTSEQSKLDRVVFLLNKYPSVKIKVTSHTDNIGRDSFNFRLSDSRAESSKLYIIYKGIDPNRIISMGLGETKPVNRCKDGVRCSKKEYQLNRRTEFIIID